MQIRGFVSVAIAHILMVSSHAIVRATKWSQLKPGRIYTSVPVAVGSFTSSHAKLSAIIPNSRSPTPWKRPDPRSFLWNSAIGQPSLVKQSEL